MNVMVIAAHPDDEVLGCGGVIARHSAEGATVYILFVADGEGARNANESKITAREEMACRAAEILGTQRPVFLRLPDNRLDSITFLDIVQKIEHEVKAVSPKVVYTHAGGDMNVDHRIVHQAVRTALRPMSSNSVQRLLAFEVPSATEWGGCGFGPRFNPSVAIDVSAYSEQKSAALRAYDAEIHPMPHPRSYEAITSAMTVRGAAFGMHAAEAFELVYETIR
jgi:LmbE family N-acetylglucosaminyl deacetylase